MKYCDKCKVHVRGKNERCPLCQRQLSGDNDKQRCYPAVLTVYKQYAGFFKLLILLSVTSAVVSIAVNMIIPWSGVWSFYVAVGIGCFWLSLILAVKKRKRLPQNITWQAAIMSVLSIGWDFLTSWSGWSLNYAMPIIFVVAMGSMMILSKLLKIQVGDYLMCLIIDVVFGFIPIIFYSMGMITSPIPSLVCISCSIIVLTMIILFQGRQIMMELGKRFHI